MRGHARSCQQQDGMNSALEPSSGCHAPLQLPMNTAVSGGYPVLMNVQLRPESDICILFP